MVDEYEKEETEREAGKESGKEIEKDKNGKGENPKTADSFNASYYLAITVLTSFILLFLSNKNKNKSSKR